MQTDKRFNDIFSCQYDGRAEGEPGTWSETTALPAELCPKF